MDTISWNKSHFIKILHFCEVRLRRNTEILHKNNKDKCNMINDDIAVANAELSQLVSPISLNFWNYEQKLNGRNISSYFSIPITTRSKTQTTPKNEKRLICPKKCTFELIIRPKKCNCPPKNQAGRDDTIHLWNEYGVQFLY